MIQHRAMMGSEATVSLAISGTDAATDAGAIKPMRRYRVVASVACFLRIGAAAHATNAGPVPIYPEQPEEWVFGGRGDSPVVHVITSGATGRIDFTPITEVQL